MSWLYLARVVLVLGLVLVYCFAAFDSSTLARSGGVLPVGQVQAVYRELFSQFGAIAFQLTAWGSPLLAFLVARHSQAPDTTGLLELAGFSRFTIATSRAILALVALMALILVPLPVLAIGPVLGGVDSLDITVLLVAILAAGTWGTALGTGLADAWAQRRFALLLGFAGVAWLIWYARSERFLISLFSGGSAHYGSFSFHGRSSLFDLHALLLPFSGPSSLLQLHFLSSNGADLWAVGTTALGALLGAALVPLVSMLGSRPYEGKRAPTFSEVLDRFRPQRVDVRWAGTGGTNPMGWRETSTAGLVGGPAAFGAVAGVLLLVQLPLELLTRIDPKWKLLHEVAEMATISFATGTLILAFVLVYLSALRGFDRERRARVFEILATTPLSLRSLVRGKLGPPLTVAVLLALPWFVHGLHACLNGRLSFGHWSVAVAGLLGTWVALGAVGIVASLALRNTFTAQVLPLILPLGYLVTVTTVVGGHAALWIPGLLPFALIFEPGLSWNTWALVHTEVLAVLLVTLWLSLGEALFRRAAAQTVQ